MIVKRKNKRLPTHTTHLTFQSAFSFTRATGGVPMKVAGSGHIHIKDPGGTSIMITRLPQSYGFQPIIGKYLQGIV